jgi:large subunit ribosomal protein L18
VKHMRQSHHIPVLRRRREGKTDYRARRTILVGRRVFATVRVSGRNILVQIAQAERHGDRVLASAHSRELVRHGWKGSRKNLPAAYLTGLIAGHKAKRQGVAEAIIYAGAQPFTPNGRVAAALKGLQDAGIVVPADAEVLPKPARLHGEHIVQPLPTRMEGEKPVPRRRAAKTAPASPPSSEYPQKVQQLKAAIEQALGGKGQ